MTVRPDARAQRAERTARVVRELVAQPLPAPGGGDTGGRWAALAEWGRGDLAVARLAEGHADAVAILAEAGAAPVPGALYGVWAARPGGRGLRLVAGSDGRPTVAGTARFCSGAGLLDRALVVADPAEPPGATPAEARNATVLVEVDTRGPDLVEDPESWRADAMAGSLTRDVRFAGVAVDRVVGGPGWYTGRPGFAAGGGGVAALWWGGATALLERARRHLAGRADPHQLAHLGELHALLAGAHALLCRTADQLDAEPTAEHILEIDTLRSMVERAARETLDRVPRILGPGPCSRDGELADRLADLALYLRQHHGERDHAALGARLVGRR